MLKPMPGNIIVLPVDPEQEKRQSSGIVLPQTIEKNRPTMGKVVYTTPEDKHLKGKTVIFDMYGSHEITYEGQDLLIVSVDDLMGVMQ